MSKKFCSKCGAEVKEYILGVLSCVCSDHVIGTFSPYPETWGGIVTERIEADDRAGREYYSGIRDVYGDLLWDNSMENKQPKKKPKKKGGK